MGRERKKRFKWFRSLFFAIALKLKPLKSLARIELYCAAGTLIGRAINEIFIWFPPSGSPALEQTFTREIPSFFCVGSQFFSLFCLAAGWKLRIENMFEYSHGIKRKLFSLANIRFFLVSYFCSCIIQYSILMRFLHKKGELAVKLIRLVHSARLARIHQTSIFNFVRLYCRIFNFHSSSILQFNWWRYMHAAQRVSNRRRLG